MNIKIKIIVFSEITGFGNYCSLRPESLQMQTTSIKVCEYSRSRSFHDDLILQDQASGERSQDHWSSGYDLKKTLTPGVFDPALGLYACIVPF